MNDLLKPSHRWSNGPWPSKTIETIGWIIITLANSFSHNHHIIKDMNRKHLGAVPSYWECFSTFCQQVLIFRYQHSHSVSKIILLTIFMGWNTFSCLKYIIFNGYIFFPPAFFCFHVYHVISWTIMVTWGTITMDTRLMIMSPITLPRPPLPQAHLALIVTSSSSVSASSSSASTLFYCNFLSLHQPYQQCWIILNYSNCHNLNKISWKKSFYSLISPPPHTHTKTQK